MSGRDRAGEPRAVAGCRAPADGDHALDPGAGPVASNTVDALNVSVRQ